MLQGKVKAPEYFRAAVEKSGFSVHGGSDARQCD